MMNIDTLINTEVAKLTCPILGLTGSEMGLKPIITEEGSQLSIHMCTGFPSGFLEENLKPILMRALTGALPDHEISITFDHFIKAHRTQFPGKGLRGIKNTIAIASGKGGVGKSTVTVNLAAALARAGARVGILDADIYGPSIPLMLGKQAPLQIENNRYLPVLAHGIQAMSIGYLTAGEHALIWRGPMLAKSLLHLINSTEWDELDYLFIDLPPGTGDIQLSLVQKIPLTGAIVVTTPQTVATMDAEKAITLFEKTNIDVLGLIENMSLHTCHQCGHQEALFSSGGAERLAKTRGCTLLGQLPLDARITTHCDSGIPTAASNTNGELATSFIKTALKAALVLEGRPLNYAVEVGVE